MKQWIKWGWLLVASVSLSACADTDAPEIAPGANQEEGENSTETDAQMATLNVDLYNSDSEIVGTAILDEGEESVSLTLSLENVNSGELNVQLHKNGSATPPSFEDAGEAISGIDTPNLEVSENGVINQTLELENVSILPEEDGTLATESGTSIIIHSEMGNTESDNRLIGGVIFPPQ
ncbi:hypothetical protein BKP56_05050 [Marinilactibacillus sp. 15R]|uniref:hypothetical protein n=1 Tax=Marinilactibacillus sp. 15R TaxID=1911586 RepID=UPI00090CB176|nr:hypothetical protein [Marinilactibacillus sp. 15R]API88693.1 hypothetical protein BKP56_05050 [Marinilactibacillus sp. 15R]